MDILNALNDIEKLELKLEYFYKSLCNIFSSDADASALFKKLSEEERSHYDLVQYQKRLVIKNRNLFQEVTIDVDEIKRIISKVETITGSLPPPSLEKAVKVSTDFETSAAEYHYRTSMEQSNPDVATFLKSLGKADNEHSNSLRDLAKSRGFGI